jgi:hypothetical protein
MSGSYSSVGIAVLTFANNLHSVNILQFQSVSVAVMYDGDQLKG